MYELVREKVVNDDFNPEEMADIFKTELLLGAAAGIRYLMLPNESINIGFDAAKGKGDWGMYFRIGESFGR
jgi:hypothetical protein